MRHTIRSQLVARPSNDDEQRASRERSRLSRESSLRSGATRVRGKQARCRAEASAQRPRRQGAATELGERDKEMTRLSGARRPPWPRARVAHGRSASRGREKDLCEPLGVQRERRAEKRARQGRAGTGRATPRKKAELRAGNSAEEAPWDFGWVALAGQVALGKEKQSAQSGRAPGWGEL